MIRAARTSRHAGRGCHAAGHAAQHAASSQVLAAPDAAYSGHVTAGVMQSLCTRDIAGPVSASAE